MKALLVALNASFIHTNLAVRLLQKSTDTEVEILELTINEKKDYILKKILQVEPSHVFWSSYIWNWEFIRDIADTINKIDPSIIQFVGGPEVSYDIDEHLETNPWIQGIIVGEGEEVFKQLVNRLKDGRDWRQISGIAYRLDNNNFINPPILMSNNLDHLPQLDYLDEDVSHKILYYEAMRGCPYKCSYCLSSLDEKVRYRSISKIKEDLKVLFKTGTKQIKFVDRSFGINKDRAVNLLKFMKDHASKDINIHLEMNLENLDPEIIEVLVNSRKGLFQIEAGVQSTNDNVLDKINRNTNIASIAHNMEKLEKGQIHRHLDLIVGLPGEDLTSFFKGFDEVYHMKPERIQIGFLKLLRGTSLRKDSHKLGIKFEDKAPYTVIQTADLSGYDILYLKSFESIIETYCDEHKFSNVNKYIIKEIGERPSKYFGGLAKYYDENVEKYGIKNIKGKYLLLFDYFNKFYTNHARLLYDYLKMDFYLQEDYFIEKALPVNDKEMHKSEIMSWLRQLSLEDYRELGEDIHRASRMCRGISFEALGTERVFLYKNHKYIRHFERQLGGNYE